MLLHVIQLSCVVTKIIPILLFFFQTHVIFIFLIHVFIILFQNVMINYYLLFILFPLVKPL